MSEKPDGRKVDWSKVLTKIVGKPLSVGGIRKVALENSKRDIYYSEVLRFVRSLETRKDLTIEKRVTNRSTIYLIRRKESGSDS